MRSKRNTKAFYLLQHLVRCTECGRLFASRSSYRTYVKRNGRRHRQDRVTPQRHYHCYGMLSDGLRCRKPAMIRADRLEELVWSQVKSMIQHPELIVAGIEAMDTQEDGALEMRSAKAERELRKVQTEEERAIRLFVSGKITEDQLDLQRKFITERLETARADLDDLRASESVASEKRTMMENLIQWAGEFGGRLDELPDEKRRDVLRLLVDQILVDKDNKVSITLGIPTDSLMSIEKVESRFEPAWNQSAFNSGCCSNSSCSTHWCPTSVGCQRFWTVLGPRDWGEEAPGLRVSLTS